MNTPAAIDVQIVDIKNDPQHKGSIRITAHVPVERGAELTAALGWPTYTSPVPAALAVLDLKAGNAELPAREARQREDKPLANPASRSFNLANHIGMLCASMQFHCFLESEFSERWRLLNNGAPIKKAAEIVRSLCDVKSRSEIENNPDALNKWQQLFIRYNNWQRNSPF